jgi:ketosteroid isomerase-like protein
VSRRHLIAAIVLALPATVAAQDTSATASLIEAELAFARRVTESDERTAFLEVLAADAVVFRPGLVDAVEWYRRHPARPMQLSSSPAIARVSAAGDLGYTTGPYRARAIGSARVVGEGYYLSIWRRERGRPWELLTDLGVETDAPDEPLPSRTAPRRGASFPDGARARTALLEANEAWSRRGSRLKDAERLADPEIRVLRRGRPLAKGIPAAAAAMIASTREPGGTGLVAVAASLDFGYTRGLRLEPARGGETRVHYVRVWVTDHDGRWRIVADVETPEPAAAALPDGPG